jgi:hypothetical protein
VTEQWSRETWHIRSRVNLAVICVLWVGMFVVGALNRVLLAVYLLLFFVCSVGVSVWIRRHSREARKANV